MAFEQGLRKIDIGSGVACCWPMAGGGWDGHRSGYTNEGIKERGGSGHGRRGLLPAASAAIFCLVLAALPSTGFGEPLDKAACTELAVIRQKHIKSGIEETFTKGAEWAKANLPEASLADIKEYLMVQDQLLFRCQTVKIELPSTIEKTDTSSATTEASAGTVVRTVPLPVRPSKPKR